MLFNYHTLPNANAATISDRLSLYDQIRAGRVAATQIYADMPYFEDVVAVQKEKCEQFLSPEALPQSKEELPRWEQSYNVLEHAERELRLYLEQS